MFGKRTVGKKIWIMELHCRSEERFRPHRLWLALLATRLSRELVGCKRYCQRAGEFGNRDSEANDLLEINWITAY